MPRCKLPALLVLLLMPCAVLVAQPGKRTLSGYIKDAASGEVLTGANLQLKEIGAGTTSNEYGFFSISVPPGIYTLVVDYVGYQSAGQQVDLSLANQKLNLNLAEQGVELGAVEITAKRDSKQNVQSTAMSQNSLEISQIKKIPALFGEVDLIRTLLFLPGVQSAGEGTGGFFVRGGGIDQNLILLDEATVYNASHLLGFFSVFNSDAVKDVDLYKGGIPARYGGRLSSLVDIHMKEGNTKKFSGQGGIGIIASRLTLEGPINKGRGSFMVSGRRTYADLFLKLSSNKDLRNTSLYFYDLNLKANYELNSKNRIYLSAYFGRDVLKSATNFGFNWGNATATFRWNHLFSDRFFSNLTAIYSSYDYQIIFGQSSNNGAQLTSSIQDLSLKYDLTYFFSARSQLHFGLISTHHTFMPGSVQPIGQSIFNNYGVPSQFSQESALYVDHEYNFTSRFSARYGLRYSTLTTLGPATIYKYDYENTDPIGRPTVLDSTRYNGPQAIKTYAGWEPRLGLRYLFNDENSVKLSYMRTYQYVHLASNSSASLPVNLWIMSNSYIKPQYADQVAAGFFRNLFNNSYEFSVELYYKWLYNQIDFRNYADLNLNRQLEKEILIGKGWSYGSEFYLRKVTGRATGWVSYTLSRTMRQTPGINNGIAYPAFSDRRHNLAMVGNYQVNKRVSLSASWTYTSGAPVTFPSGIYIAQTQPGVGSPVNPPLNFPGQPSFYYTERNGYRLPAYHRLDLSLNLENKEKPGRRWHGSWNFSVYNAYGRHNTWAVQFSIDPKNPSQIQVQKLYLFSFVPSVTYNFKF